MECFFPATVEKGWKIYVLVVVSVSLVPDQLFTSLNCAVIQIDLMFIDGCFRGLEKQLSNQGFVARIGCCKSINRNNS